MPAEAPYPFIIVVGAGAVLQEKFTPDVLNILGPQDRRIIIDINPARVEDQETATRGPRLVADAIDYLPFNLEKLPDAQREDAIAVITTPNHLGPIRSLVSSGVQRFIVEKPLVNNSQEISKLEEIIKQHRGVRVYPLDFYVQKVAPLLVLTGAIKPKDPRFDWVTMSDGRKVGSKFRGTMSQLIGNIEGIEVTVFEGGSLGVPDLDKRQWLETDNLRGGMLLDLGTHALAPIMAAGIVPTEGVKVEDTSRLVLGKDRRSYVKALPGQPEIYARALLTMELTTVEKESKRIPLLLTVGKTFHDGGMWKLIIRGSNGEISMGLRTGQRLTVEPKEGKAFQLKLKANNPYAMAFQEAQMYFEGYPGFDGNLSAMLSAIKIIDDIKKKSS